MQQDVERQLLHLYERKHYTWLSDRTPYGVATLQWRLSLEQEIAANQSRTTHRPAKLTVTMFANAWIKNAKCSTVPVPTWNWSNGEYRDCNWHHSTVRSKTSSVWNPETTAKPIQAQQQRLADRFCFCLCQNLQWVQNRIKGNGG